MGNLCYENHPEVIHDTLMGKPSDLALLTDAVIGLSKIVAQQAVEIKNLKTPQPS